MGHISKVQTDVLAMTESLRHNLQSALMTIECLDAEKYRPPSSLPTATEVKQLLQKRRNRDKFFPDGLFADPAWDMLLELYGAHLRQTRLSVSSLCIGSAVPQTTALRWISTLENEGLISRRRDPLDARRVFIALTPQGLLSLEAYFSSCAGTFS